MMVHTFEDESSWLEARKGKITGSKLKDIISKRNGEKKIGFYELIAERLTNKDGNIDNPMERGHALEPEAVERFEKETGKLVDKSLILWVSDENKNIALSPDGVIGETEAVEVKCLSSARHIEALLNQKVPSEYEYQILQYFIVNEKLEKLYMVFYDPRLIVKDYFYIQVEREELKEKIEIYRQFQTETLLEVEEIINQLSF